MSSFYSIDIFIIDNFWYNEFRLRKFLPYEIIFFMKVSFKGSQNGIDAERKLIIDEYYLYGLDQVKRVILGLGLKRHMKGLP